MSNSTHQIIVKGVDQTSGAFGSIKARAKSAASGINSMLGGALAAAGAYLGLRQIKGGIDELGHLSDIAQKTSTSVDELTRASTGLSVLGIQNVGVDQLAKSFDYMAKTTGRSGMDGFYKTIEELGKIEDPAKRGQEAMRIFGRSGMELMPLINAADTSVDALQTVVNAMPGIPQAAANAGDAASDAMAIAGKQLKSIWLQGLGTVVGWLDNEFTGGTREASLKAANYMEYYAKVGAAKVIAAFQKTQEYLKRFGDTIGAFIGAKMNGAAWSEAFDFAVNAYEQAVGNYEVAAEEIDKREAERTERFKRAFEDREIAVEHFAEAYDSAAVSLAKREEKNAAKREELALKTPQVRNELILGGNEANRIALLGPQLQSESKKQTDALNKVAKNTERIAENTESAGGEDGEGLATV